MLLLQALDLMAEGKHIAAVSRPLDLYKFSDDSWVPVSHTGPIYIYIYIYIYNYYHHPTLYMPVSPMHTIPAFMAITEVDGRQRIMAEIDSSMACATGTP